MKFTKLYLVLLLSLSLQVFGQEESSGKALVIIDMQRKFITRGGNHKKAENVQKVQTILATQSLAIQAAKKQNLPIVFLEYSGSYGDTTAELKDLVKGYKNAKFVKKTSDGMFASYNKHKKELTDYLKNKKVKKLIITGANGGACVKRSISGCLSEGYEVVAFSKGIADFNHSDFIYPYDDKYKGFCNDKKFCEVDDIKRLREILKKKASAASPTMAGAIVAAKVASSAREAGKNIEEKAPGKKTNNAVEATKTNEG